MNPEVTVLSLQHAIEKLSARMEPRIEELNRRDGELGDGDLGVTVSRGIEGLLQVSPELPADIGLAFDECARAIIQVSGSTFGTLLATGLQVIGKALRGRTSASWREILPLLEDAIEAIKKRSGAASGDKTAVDSLEQIALALSGEEDPVQIKEHAVLACQEALDLFRPKPCKQGRARIFGERSKGRDDPGMLAIYYIVAAL